MPLVNVKLHGWEVDFCWPDLLLVLELDGGAYHSDRLSRDRDQTKTRHLEKKGYQVIRVSWSEYDADPKGSVDMIVSRYLEAEARHVDL